MNDDELLRVVISEQERSIGFDYDADLTQQREIALEYYKGEMRDVPSMPNRSRAVSMDVRDGIQAILPDLLDIFTNGEDVVAFVPRGEEDVDAAKQETDYLNFVVFQENDGWQLFQSVILDALQAKTGVFKWWVEEGYQPDDERFEGKTFAELQKAAESGEIVEYAATGTYDDETGEPLFSFTLRKDPDDGKICIASVAPEDITVARDTVRLKDATYCATRSRPRAQDLLAQGISRELVDGLPEWVTTQNNAVPQARDTVEEGEQIGGASLGDMRQVEVVEHYIRLKDGGKEKLWCVLTGGQGSSAIILRKEEVDQIQLSAITPYLVSHRFYGNSLADFLIDIQRMKSQLQRMTMDAGYFALNQRHEVDESGCSDNTVTDLLRNEPGVPVRVKRAGTVTPIASPGLNVDTLSYLEYFSVQMEERTGIVRSAQGLNPDTLHETKGGMLAQLARAQKRIRMVARTMAETGIKDMYLGVHALIRQTASKERIVRLRNKFVTIDPSGWGERNDMSIEIGVGAGGREQEMVVLQQIMEIQAQAVGAGLSQLVTPDNLYNSATRFAEKAGIKTPELYFSDPKEAPPQEPQPDPAMLEMQAKQQLEQQKLELSAQNDAAQLEQAQQKALGEYELKQMDIEAKRYQAELDDRYRRDQAESELAFKQAQFEQELALKQWQIEQEIELQRERMAMDVHKHQASLDNDANIASNVQVGGEPG